MIAPRSYVNEFMFDYRTGLIKAGDVIIAINGQCCDYVTLNEAVTMLKKTDDVVSLKIKKDGNSMGDNYFIVYANEATIPLLRSSGTKVITRK